MKKCINCGRFPFCNKIEDSQQEACEEFIKRSLESEVTKIENKKRKEEVKIMSELDKKISDFYTMCKSGQEAFGKKMQMAKALKENGGMVDYFIKTENYNAIIVVIDKSPEIGA